MSKDFNKNTGQNIMQADMLEKLIESELINTFYLDEGTINNIFSDDLYQEIINTKAFQRLRKIHFMGSIDYTILADGFERNVHHTRYQHSLGVASLALRYSINHNLNEKDKYLCVVSAFLHDIGHAPLSHSLESVFDKSFGLNHHITGEAIIKGDVNIGKDLSKILKKWKINPFEIMTIIAEHGGSPHRELFSYPINIDTIEAITRANTYINNNISLSKSRILDALLPCDNKKIGSKENTVILDKFWVLKNTIYNSLIQSRWGIVADYLCQKYMYDNINNFNMSYYYGTEEKLLKDHKELFKYLENIETTDLSIIIPNEHRISYIERKFFINKNSPVKTLESLNERYHQSKTKKVKIFRQGHYETTSSNRSSIDLFK